MLNVSLCIIHLFPFLYCGYFTALYFICLAHSCYSGVPKPFHLAVCVCSRCNFLRHTNVSRCPSSSCYHMLFHPKILSSGIEVRISTRFILAIEMCSEVHDMIPGNIVFKSGSCQGFAPVWKLAKFSTVESAYFASALFGTIKIELLESRWEIFAFIMKPLECTGYTKTLAKCLPFQWVEH